MEINRKGLEAWEKNLQNKICSLEDKHAMIKQGLPYLQTLTISGIVLYESATNCCETCKRSVCYLFKCLPMTD